MKKSKLATPEWILEGYKSKVYYEKAKGIKKEKKSGRIFKIKECPKCKSDDVGVMITREECKGGKCDWECRKCSWKGGDIAEKEVGEDEFMKYLDEKGENLPDENELKKDFKKTIESSGNEDLGDEE